MDKKLIIGVVVAALIMFIWQFLSWSVINLHKENLKYTDKQDVILKVLEENLEPGSYFLPTVAPNTSQADHEKMMVEMTGKPWAQVSYHKSFKMEMGMNMFRGLVADLLAAFLLCWLLMKIPGIDFKTTLLSSLAVGFIGFLTVNYLGSIWFENSTMSALIDAIVQWALVGAWLGWWLNRD